jgi:hypothetical protein
VLYWALPPQLLGPAPISFELGFVTISRLQQNLASTSGYKSSDVIGCRVSVFLALFRHFICIRLCSFNLPLSFWLHLHVHQCKSLLVIWTWRRRRRRQCKTLAGNAYLFMRFLNTVLFCNCLTCVTLTWVCSILYLSFIFPNCNFCGSECGHLLCTIYLVNLSVGQLLTLFSLLPISILKKI